MRSVCDYPELAKAGGKRAPDLTTILLSVEVQVAEWGIPRIPNMIITSLLHHTIMRCVYHSLYP